VGPPLSARERERESARKRATRPGLVEPSERERAGACVGRAYDWAEQGKKRREAVRAAIFVFLFQKYEIVTVFVYFILKFLELQNY
jgi:hypothetical protein